MNKLVSLLILCSFTLALQPPTLRAQQATVCFYFKKIDAPQGDAAYYVKILNKTGSSNPLTLRLSGKMKTVQIDYGRSGGSSLSADNAQRELTDQVGALFSTYDAAKLKTPNAYKTLFDLITDGGVLLKELNLSQYGVPDKVYAFNFDAVAANYGLLKETNMQSKEAAAFYNFTLDLWSVEKATPDYASRIQKKDFGNFLSPEVAAKIFEQEKPATVAPSFTDAYKKMVENAESRATWAIIVAAIGVLVIFYLTLILTSSLRRRTEQFSKIESKVKQMEMKLNRPFYQVEQGGTADSRFSKLIEAQAFRITVLEKQLGIKSPEPIDFKDALAGKLNGVVRQHREKFLTEPKAVGENGAAETLALYLDEFNSELRQLDAGMEPQSFVQKHLIPHIDSVDGLFQAEPDATLNPPPSVAHYLTALMQTTGVTEIDIKLKVSRFDIEKHEKAGSMLKTTYDAGTILKVLRRGLVYGNSLRKAQVVKAE